MIFVEIKIGFRTWQCMIIFVSSGNLFCGKFRVGIGGDPKLSKQMRSFGALKWSQWSQKKCSEQLRSSSIDGSCQMAHTGTRKLQKRSVDFWNLDHCDVAVLLTAKFLMFLGLGWLWKSKIRSQKSILVKNLIKFLMKTILVRIYLHSSVVPISLTCVRANALRFRGRSMKNFATNCTALRWAGNDNAGGPNAKR